MRAVRLITVPYDSGNRGRRRPPAASSTEDLGAAIAAGAPVRRIEALTVAAYDPDFDVADRMLGALLGLLEDAARAVPCEGRDERTADCV